MTQTSKIGSLCSLAFHPEFQRCIFHLPCVTANAQQSRGQQAVSALHASTIQSRLCLHEPDYKLHAQNCQHHHLCVAEASQNLPGASVINTSSLEYCSSINKNALKQTPRASRDQCNFFSYWLQARNAVAVSWFRDALPLFLTGSPDKLLTPTCWTDWGVNIFCSPRGCDEGWKRSAGTKRENI